MSTIAKAILIKKKRLKDVYCPYFTIKNYSN